MSEYVTQPGTYKGYIKAYELRKAQSGSKGIHITVQIEETFVDNEWHDWREYDFEAEGTFWVVKKDGTLNSYAVDPMMEYAGWDGDFTAIVQKTWEPKPVNITVKEEVYNDAVTLRIDYLNEYDRGGSGGGCTLDEAQELQKLLGPQLRALAGNSVRNAEPPKDAPKRPKAEKAAKKTKKSITKSTPKPAPVEDEDNEDIPF